MQNTRVLHVLDHSLPILSGYSSRTHHLLRAQLESGLLPLAVTSPKHGVAAGQERIDEIAYFRAPVTRAGFASGVSGISEIRLMRQLAARVGQVAREQESQILHAHSPVLNGIPALRVARRAGIPVVYEIRAFWEDAAVDHGTHRTNSPRYRLIRALETWVMRHVDAVGVISRGLAQEVCCRGIPESKVFYIPNGVDTRFFRPIARDPELVKRWGLGDSVVIGFIGSFYRYEGLDDLLQAWAHVVSDLPHARLLLIGAGEAVASLQEAARRLRIESSVVFAGTVPHADIARCYSVCDVLVYPRKRMRLTELVTPLKPLEAMAAGKMVIASDVGGLRELVHDRKTGLLFPAGDTEALAQVLQQAVREPDLRAALSQAGRLSVCQEREWKNLVTVYLDTYKRLLTRPGVSA